MDDFKPSAFTPFLRRFTDERARDLEDTRSLYDRVRLLHATSNHAKEFADVRLTDDILCACPSVSEPLRPVILQAILAVLACERPIFECPYIDFMQAQFSLKEQVDLRHFLRAKEYFHAHEAKVIGLLKESLALIFGTITEMLPETFDPSPFTIPLVFSLPEPKRFLSQLIGELSKERPWKT